MKLFDTDKSGDISLEEFVFFLTFYYLRFNEKYGFKDIKNISQLDFLENYKRTQKLHNIGLKGISYLDSRHNKVSSNSLDKEKEFINILFKQRETITISELVEFKNKISDEINTYKVI